MNNMDPQEEFEKIVQNARADEALKFLVLSREMLIDLVEADQKQSDYGRVKLIKLIDRMIDAEMEYLEAEPESYLELYGD
jgi:hypothetical protein